MKKFTDELLTHVVIRIYFKNVKTREGRVRLVMQKNMH